MNVETMDVENGTKMIVAEIVNENSDMLALVKETDKPVFQAMSKLSSLNWHDLKPNETALLLMQKPFLSGGATMYLNFRQALLFAVRAYELGLSPFSDNVWFDTTRNAVNISTSGKRELARIRGIEMGPPQFTETSRAWDSLPKITAAGEAARKAGFTHDVGVTCTIRVGPVANKETVSFTAWISDWYMDRSPVWKERFSHMLNIRANEKALTLILGAGISQMPDDVKDLE